MVVPILLPLTISIKSPEDLILKTFIGILFSWQSVIAVMSITLKSSCITLLYDNLSYFLELLFFSGSLSYTPSTFVPFNNISEPNSFALNAAAESVVKKDYQYLRQ